MKHPHPLLSRNGVLLAVGGGGLILFLCFRPARALAADLPATQRISVAAAGGQAGGPSAYPTISDDGQWVAFASDAANLVACDTNGAGDVFVKNRASGAIVCVSVSTGGTPAEGESYAASISGDGTRIVFVSEGTNLVAGDQNGLPDVFVRDLVAGTLSRVSVSAGGEESNGASTAPRISADGRFVAFVSLGTNLVTGDTNGMPDVFVRDLQTGTLERISVTATGEPADGASEGPAISADGRFVAFASTARNLIPGEGGEAGVQSWDVYRRDRQTGSIVRASVSPTGGKGDGHSFAPAISADGRHVVFASLAANLITSDLNGKTDVLLRDLQSSTTVRVSVGLGGLEPTGESLRPAISADGRFVAFESSAGNLVSEPAPEGSTWCYVRDLASATTIRVVSASIDPLADGGAVSPALSGDGHWVVFSSSEADLVAGDSNSFEDVFLRGPLP